MFSIVIRSATISRLSCNLFDKFSIGRTFLSRINKYSGYIGGYVDHNSTRFLRNSHRKLLQTSVQSFSSNSGSLYSTEFELSTVQYEKICNETLESLTEYFEELVEEAGHLSDADVFYGDGVLTIKFGKPYGTYVINRQTPNKQIWLSSPKSGPKRYDFKNGQWVYRHDGKTIHELLNNEIPAIIRNQACFDKCSYSGREKQAMINSLSPQD